MTADRRYPNVQLEFGGGHAAALDHAPENAQQPDVHIADLSQQGAIFWLHCSHDGTSNGWHRIIPCRRSFLSAGRTTTPAADFNGEVNRSFTGNDSAHNAHPRDTRTHHYDVAQLHNCHRRIWVTDPYVSEPPDLHPRNRMLSFSAIQNKSSGYALMTPPRKDFPHRTVPQTCSHTLSTQPLTWLSERAFIASSASAQDVRFSICIFACISSLALSTASAPHRRCPFL